MDKPVLIGYYNTYIFGKYEIYFDNGLVYYIDKHKKVTKRFIYESRNIEKAKELVSKLSNCEVL